ncbi:MAG: hypothetical protein ACREYE_00100 [Gammaproteobacteria bacterium]
MSRSRWKRVALRLAMLVGFLVITFGTGLGLLLWSQSAPPSEISRTLASLRPWLFVWRLLLLGALIGLWPALCRRVVRWRNLAEPELNRLLAARWTVAAWLLALELLLGQNVVGKFVLYLQKA